MRKTLALLCLAAAPTTRLRNRPSNGYYLRSVNDGVIDADPY